MKPNARRFAAPALLLALLAIAPRIEAQSAPTTLEEEVAVARARLQLVIDKVRAVPKAARLDGGLARKDLLRRGAYYASSTKSFASEDGAREAIEAMEALREEALRFLSPGEDGGAEPEGPVRLRSAHHEVVAFRDVADDAERVRAGLTEDEYRSVRELTREGEDLVLELHGVRERDHEAREDLLLRLREKREMLAELWRSGLTPRTEGHPFVALRRSGQQWTDVWESQDGWEALRTRFIEPQSAYVTVRNTADRARELAIEIEFLDVAGEPTGTAAAATGPVDLIGPGEIREIFLSIALETPRFWSVTRTYVLELR